MSHPDTTRVFVRDVSLTANTLIVTMRLEAIGSDSGQVVRIGIPMFATTYMVPS